MSTADLLFPDVTRTPADLLAEYAPRDLPEDAIVSRFAPSPTGFIHIGGIYTALISWMLTNQTDGVYILRIEDTDQKRQIEEGVRQIVESLMHFGLVPDEGPYTIGPVEVRGDYGPYLQSERVDIYKVFARDLVEKGLAYPSFQTSEELEAMREAQKAQKVKPGYYGPWAKDRELTEEQIAERLAAGEPFVIRVRAPYPNKRKAAIKDVVRGKMELPGNDKDMVILKSDFLPTYHFAHAVDDTLMRVNLIVRGDEWLSTLPLHVQLFEMLDLPVPTYAHISPIGKQDEGSKRKLSKRKDPEAAASYYLEKGYPARAILEYCLNLINSQFENWRVENPEAPFAEFPLDLSRMSPSLALFDLDKLDSISKDVIATYNAQEVYQAALDWAREYDPDLAAIIEADRDYSITVFGVERGGEAPRKDLANWSDVREAYGFFWDELYAQSIAEQGYIFPDVAPEDIASVMDFIIGHVQDLPDRDTWLQDMRDFSEEAGFAPNRKTYKKDPDAYKGQFGDVMMIYRVALANQRYTPDLYEMVQALGIERTVARLERVKQWAEG
ncbi:MAG: glutamate--tRNA ligase [Chloroflexi bacterium]|nr:glutamate--tRNA ligase [Chloroflexota bacterium]